MVMHTGSCSRQCMQYFCRSQWPHDLRRGFAAAHLLVLWVRIPSAGVDVCRECWVCCQVERGLCVGLITRSDEFRPTNCVSESDRETSIMRKLSHKGLLGHGGGGMPCCLKQVYTDPGRLNLVRWRLLFSAQLLQPPSPATYSSVRQLTCTEQKAREEDWGSHVTPGLWVFVWNLLLVTILPPRICRWLLDFSRSVSLCSGNVVGQIELSAVARTPIFVTLSAGSECYVSRCLVLKVSAAEVACWSAVLKLHHAERS